jgi:hypothetical protein
MCTIDYEPTLPYTLAHALALGTAPALEVYASVGHVTEIAGALESGRPVCRLGNRTQNPGNVR